jgi:hypothetical protein
MKKIDISTKKYPNTFALVDDIDYERLIIYKWYAKEMGLGKVYAYRNSRVKGKRPAIAMHMEIMGVVKNKEIDHRSGITLDNRRGNLRHCTAIENQMNRGAQTNNTSGYKGVHWSKEKNKWRSQIGYRGGLLYIGAFFCLVRAAKAYDKKAKELYGEFAWLNFP